MNAVSYTLDDIEACDATVATDFVLAQHIEFANVMNTGGPLLSHRSHGSLDFFV